VRRARLEVRDEIRHRHPMLRDRAAPQLREDVLECRLFVRHRRATGAACDWPGCSANAAGASVGNS
jgi:hypothetical protein